MPETPQNWEIDVDQAAEILGVSTRTIRRYVKEGKIDHRRVQGKFGEELRFNEEELRQLARTMSNGVGKGRQASQDSSVNGVKGSRTQGLSPEALWQAYQELQAEYRNAAAQIGFLRSRAEEVPKLAERAESLQKQKEEAEKARAAAEEEKKNLAKELEQVRRQMLWNTLAYIILVLAVAGFLIILSPHYSEFIANLLKP